MKKISKMLVSLMSSTMMIANCSGLILAEEAISENDNPNIEEVEVVADDTTVTEEQEEEVVEATEEDPVVEEEVDEEEVIEEEEEASEIVILENPESYIGEAGTKAYFSVVATGDDLTYLWQYQLAGKTNWSSWTTKTSDTMSITISDTYDGAKVRCKIMDSHDQVAYSKTAKISVGTPMEVLEQPQNYVGLAGGKAVFSVVATGDDITYLWQYQYAGSTSWNSWTSKTTPSTTVTISDTYNGAKVRCKITDCHGNVIYSASAKITIGTPIEILEQPDSFIGPVGAKATFAVAATGDDITYLWQYQLAGKSSWSSWTTKTTNSTTVTISDTYDGAKIRCKITDKNGNVVYSNSASISIGTPIVISQHPTDMVGPVGSAANFSVVATGDGITYLWQYQKPGKINWSPWSTKTTASSKVTISEDLNGAKVRCKITDKNGNVVYSNYGTIYVGSVFKITEQPTEIKGAVDTSVPVSVNAEGDGLTYLWQYKTEGKTQFSSWTSKTTPSTTIKITDALDGAVVRCKVMDSHGAVLYTKEVTIVIIIGKDVDNDETELL